MDLRHSKVIEKDVIFANRDGVKAWWSGGFGLGQNVHLFGSIIENRQPELKQPQGGNYKKTFESTQSLQHLQR